MTTFTYRKYNVIFIGVFLAPFVLMCVVFMGIAVGDRFWSALVVATLGALYLGWSSFAWLFAYKNARVTMHEGKLVEVGPFGRTRSIDLSPSCEMKTRTMMRSPLGLIHKITVRASDGSSVSFNSLINDYSVLKHKIKLMGVETDY